MVEGLAKSSEQTQPIAAAPAKDTQPISSPSEIVHDEVYRYFNISSFDNFDKNQLETINKWALNDSDISKGLKKIRTLERQLGTPSVGETRMSKLYNWIRLSDHINSVRNDMDKEIGTINQRAKTTIDDIKQTYKEKVTKLDSEIKQLTKLYNQTSQRFRLNATESSRDIKNKYGKQLEELIEMRKAFKGN